MRMEARDDGAVFYMGPETGPAFSDAPDTDSGIIVAQVTVASTGSFEASIGAQGRSNGSEPDWDQQSLGVGHHSRLPALLTTTPAISAAATAAAAGFLADARGPDD